MVAQETLLGNWDEVKAKIRGRWGQLTDNDLTKRVGGDIDELTKLIQRKTGQGREAIETYLHEIGAGTSSMLDAASEKVRQCAHQASESFGDVQKQAMDQIGAGYAEARRFVRNQPGVALAACFGVGLLAGLVLWMSRRN